MNEESGFLGLLNQLANNVAQGYGQGLATDAIGGGRLPTGQYTDPLKNTLGGAGQPGTTPATVATAPQWIAGVSNTNVLLGAGVLGLVGLLLVLRK